VGRLTTEDLRSPDGWSWSFECLHGHIRKHVAMLGPWAAEAAEAEDAAAPQADPGNAVRRRRPVAATKAR